jgi:hypothetical protein
MLGFFYLKQQCVHMCEKNGDGSAISCRKLESSDVVRAHHVTWHNTPIHNILSTAPQLRISQKALGTLPEDSNVMPKHVGATTHN